MSQRTILSPGVQIFERDESLRAPQNVGTNVFICGYTQQGPVDEVLHLSTMDELEAIYGPPTNSAERYFYHGVKELVDSPANIYTYRLPYGAGAGAGYGSQYSALAYPTLAYNEATSSIQTNLTITDGVYALGEPVHVVLTESEYYAAKDGTLFTWSNEGSNQYNLSALSALGHAGMIVFNKSQTSINSQFEGFYVGVADNTNINPDSDYNSIIEAKSLSLSSNIIGLSGDNINTYTEIPLGTLQFSLSSSSTGVNGSISQIMENLTTYDIDGREDDDLLNVGVFKLRKSLYATQAFKLDYVLDSAIVGSIDSYRTALNPGGGVASSFFIENTDESSRNVEVVINPNISNKNGTTSIDAEGKPKKKIRVITHELLNNNDVVKSGIPTESLSTLPVRLGYADSLYAVGAYSDSKISSKELGDMPTKIERALDSVRNDEIYDIDVIVEAGLGTIYTMSRAAGTTYYDDTLWNTTLSGKLQSLRTSNDINGDAVATDIRGDYTTIFNAFENFCNLPVNTGGRGDCVFICDPIRHIMVTGENTKVLSDRSKNFTTDIYWAMRHQLELEDTSYGIAYGNWSQTYDRILGTKVWVPFSSVAGAIFARNDAQEFPWAAPAGYTRGLVSGNVTDLAITPNQKQRDDLYKSGINPVIFSAANGMAIYGQKTLSRKPSAFDRINVRRLFLALERPTKKVSQYFVFEPNTEYTRARLLNTLTPIFEYAKQNGGLSDYIIVVDNRNNTPEVIDANELKVDIYIKAVRTGEFILVTFTSTRTDTNLNELV